MLSRISESFTAVIQTVRRPPALAVSRANQPKCNQAPWTSVRSPSIVNFSRVSHPTLRSRQLGPFKDPILHTHGERSEHQEFGAARSAAFTPDTPMVSRPCRLPSPCRRVASTDWRRMRRSVPIAIVMAVPSVDHDRGAVIGPGNGGAPARRDHCVARPTRRRRPHRRG
jgi:hypothetical protein